MPSKPPNARARQAAAQSKVSKNMFDAKRGSARKRGYTHEWQNARASYLAEAENALCRMHLERRLAVSATVVDHKVPHKGDYTLMWARSNWQPLCKHCHDAIKQAEEAEVRLRQPRG